MESKELSVVKDLPKLEAFVGELQKNPPKNEVLINKMANNSKYLPISFVQMKLDEYFGGLWETRNFETKTVANEIVGSIELRVFHPVAKEWITRIGAAAVMIQFKSKSNGGSDDITDINNKIKNTLVKDYPHLLSECLKNAARSLGVAFGRDLNREHTDTYSPLSVDLAERPELESKLLDYLETNSLPTNLHQQIQYNLPTMDTETMRRTVEHIEKSVLRKTA